MNANEQPNSTVCRMTVLVIGINEYFKLINSILALAAVPYKQIVFRLWGLSQPSKDPRRDCEQEASLGRDLEQRQWGKHVGWELGESCELCAGPTAGLTKLTRNRTWVVSGRSLSREPHIPRGLCWKRCKNWYWLYVCLRWEKEDMKAGRPVLGLIVGHVLVCNDGSCNILVKLRLVEIKHPFRNWREIPGLSWGAAVEWGEWIFVDQIVTCVVHMNALLAWNAGSERN